MVSRWKIFMCLLFSGILSGFVFLTINLSLVRQSKVSNTYKDGWCLKLKYLSPHFLHKVTKQDNNSKAVALASFPGSGNTWLRYLLQQTTGIITGSIYSDYDLLTTSFPGEGVQNSSVLIVKTHEWGSDNWTKFRRAILLVRDPHGAILAEFNRQHSGHLGLAPRDLFHKPIWEEFVRENLVSWTEMNLSWARNFPQSIKVVLYDDLVSDIRGSLLKILQFLQWPVNEETLSCAIERQKGLFKRRKTTFDPYNKRMRNKLDCAQNFIFRELRKIQ